MSLKAMMKFEAEAQKNEEEFEVAEVKIPLSTGKVIAGRFWGNKSLKPFVCIHGWLDNAGTFDKLIPLLPKQHSYLAIDLPGHGKSSWLPHGVAYHCIDFITDLTLLMKEYNWNKISIIGHSLGGFLAFFFAAIFPDKVDVIISIEDLKPGHFTAHDLVFSLKENITNFPIFDQKNQNNDYSDYSLDQIIERMDTGSLGSLTREAAFYLLRRGATRSKKNPSKYYFTRDGRLKYDFGFYFDHSTYTELAKMIKSPYLVVRADTLLAEDLKYYEEIVSILKASNPNFEFHAFQSLSHHLHLTEPELIIDVIKRFIVKNGKILSHL